LLFGSTILLSQEFPAIQTVPPPLYYSFSEIKQNFSKHVVYIQGDGKGTGIILNKHFILINAHCVPESKALLVLLYDADQESYNNPKFIGEVMAIDTSEDLAIVIVKEDLPDLPSIPFCKTSLPDLETTEVFAIGNPKGWEGRWSYTKGYVAKSPEEFEIKESNVKFNAIAACMDTFPGSSGSLILNDKGEMVGMTSGMLMSTRFTYIIPAPTIMNFLAGVYSKIQQMANNEQKSQP